MRERVWLVAGSMVVSGVIVGAQERIDTDMNWRIRQEGTTHSHVMTTLHQVSGRGAAHLRTRHQKFQIEFARLAVHVPLPDTSA